MGLWEQLVNRVRLVLFLLFYLINYLLPFHVSAVDDDSRETLILLGNEDLALSCTMTTEGLKAYAVDIAKAIGDRIGYDVMVMTVNGASTRDGAGWLC